MNRNKIAWLVLLGLALVFLLLWRFLPRSIYSVLDAPEGEIQRAYVHVTESTFDSGGPDMHFYNVNTEELKEEALAELLTILEGKGHRPDLRNLMPWITQELTAKGNRVNVSVTLVWGKDPESACHLTMLKPEEFGISARWGLWGGFDVFHPADRETLEKLRTFAVQYGQRQD